MEINKVTMLNINLLSVIAKHEGFGINTDILETNILNLVVVIGVLIYYGKSLISDIINSRKAAILRNLEDAETRFKQAADNLSFAKDQLQRRKLSQSKFVVKV